MPVLAEKKPRADEKELPLVTSEEFAKWLVKEFKMPEGKAKETAFRYPQDKREVALLLKDLIPNSSFEGINGILEGSKRGYGRISEDLRILEKYNLSPTYKLLQAGPAQLENNIKELIKRGRSLEEYARKANLKFSEEKFRDFLDDVEGGVIKNLKEKMPEVPVRDIEDFVNKTELRFIKLRLRYAEGRKIDLASFKGINDFAALPVWLISRDNVVSKLSEEMPLVPMRDIEDFAKKHHDGVITLRINTLKKYGFDLSTITDIGELDKSTEEIRESEREGLVDTLAREMPKVPRKDIEKLVDKVPLDALIRRIGALESNGKDLGEITETGILHTPVAELRAHIDELWELSVSKKKGKELEVRKAQG